jgi:hypothetical protein
MAILAIPPMHTNPKRKRGNSGILGRGDKTLGFFKKLPHWTIG